MSQEYEAYQNAILHQRCTIMSDGRPFAALKGAFGMVGCYPWRPITKRFQL